MALVSQRRSLWVALATAIVTASIAVGHVSNVALTGVDPSTVWVDSEFVLTDEPVVAGLFDVDGMLPGQTEVRCVTVRYEGAQQPVGVRLYATGIRGALASHLDVRVEVAASCDAFPPAMVAYAGPLTGMPVVWAQATGSWRPAFGDRQAYRFSVTLRDDTRAQRQEATAGFVWEARPLQAGAVGLRPHAGRESVAGLG